MEHDRRQHLHRALDEQVRRRQAGVGRDRVEALEAKYGFRFAGYLERNRQQRFPMPNTDLTPRELDVLRWAAAGLTARQTAIRLAKGVETVKSQRASVLGKLGARNFTHAVAIAIRRGLLS